MARMAKVEEYTPIAESKRLKRATDLENSRKKILKEKDDEIAFLKNALITAQ